MENVRIFDLKFTSTIIVQLLNLNFKKTTQWFAKNSEDWKEGEEGGGREEKQKEKKKGKRKKKEKRKKKHG